VKKNKFATIAVAILFLAGAYSDSIIVSFAIVNPIISSGWEESCGSDIYGSGAWTTNAKNGSGSNIVSTEQNTKDCTRKSFK
jgi:hypothetical protein